MRKGIIFFYMAICIGASGCQAGKLLDRQESSPSREPHVLQLDIAGNSYGPEVAQQDVVEDNINAESLAEDNKYTQQAKAREQALQDAVQKEPLWTDIKVLRTFQTHIPVSVLPNIQYNNYTVSLDYVIVTGENINIRKNPGTRSGVMRKANYLEKLKVLAEVKGEPEPKSKNNRWYQVEWEEGSQLKRGYILSSLVSRRTYQLEKMLESIMHLQEEVEGRNTAYISNYKNKNGEPPMIGNMEIDSYGERRFQSAPAYTEPSYDSDFRYIADGSLIVITGKEGDFYRARVIKLGLEYYIPQNYVSTLNQLKKLNKVVVIDRKYQNEAVFENKKDQWNLVSYTYATTGEKSKYKLPTDLGYFMAINKLPKFYYVDDETQEIVGYAPYAVRFSGGAYIHGVPVEYEKGADGKPIKDEKGEYKDPGMQEFLITIGTSPRSHKCVRNYTSHAKFLYDWINIGRTAVIVIE